jgi:multisubunit Na+/H+ antiporter MnhB subunit
MKQKPSLLMLSFSWSLIIALLMTAISFMHNFQGELSNPATGGIQWSNVGFLFLVWFVAAETVMLIGGGLYFGARSLFRRPKGP